MDRKEANLRVSEVAKIVGCHIGTINNYIKEGYIPEPVRDRNNHRRFTMAEAKHLKAIFNIRVPVYGAQPNNRSISHEQGK